MDLRKFDRFLAMTRPENTKPQHAKNTNDIADIPGARPDAYGRLKNIHGRDYNNVNDIVGARPRFLEKPPPINKKHYMMMTKDITDQDKKNIKKDYNPLDPCYILSTKSGRKQIIGAIDKNKPKHFVTNSTNKDTRRNMRTDDIAGAQPFYKRNANYLAVKNQDSIIAQLQNRDVPISSSHKQALSMKTIS